MTEYIYDTLKKISSFNARHRENTVKIYYIYLLELLFKRERKEERENKL